MRQVSGEWGRDGACAIIARREMLETLAPSGGTTAGTTIDTIFVALDRHCERVVESTSEIGPVDLMRPAWARFTFLSS